jgi:hypothetical protein
MPTLSFRLKKRADAAAQLVLVRDDGSFTAGAIGPHAGYGPAHDLAHYVVESTLGLGEGFLGLVASGWEIADFEVKGAAAQLPPEALFAESASGQISSEHMMAQASSAEDFNWSMRATLERGGHAGYAAPEIDAETLAGIRSKLLELHLEWYALPPGETLALTFRTARPSTRPRPTPRPR